MSDQERDPKQGDRKEPTLPPPGGAPSSMPYSLTTETAQSSVPEPNGGDPLLTLAVYLARTRNRPSSPDMLIAGLPLEGGVLSIDLLPRALARAGLVCEERRAVLADLAEFDLPALIFDPSGRVLACLARNDDGSFRCFDPDSGREADFAAADLDARAKQSIMVVREETLHSGDGAEPQLATDASHWLRDALSGHRRSIFNIILAAAFINLFAVAMPLFTLNVYDRVLPNKATATLWVLAIGLLLVQVFDLVLKVARGALIDYMGRRVDLRLASTLFDRVLNTTIASRPGSTGAFINRIAQFEVLREFFTSSTIVMFVDVFFMFVFFWVIAALIGWVAIFPAIAALVAVTVTIFIGLRSGKAVKAALSESSTRNAILVESLTAAQTVKATRAEGQLLRRWENAILASSETQNRIKILQNTANQFTALAGQLSMVAIIIGGTYRFSAGEISTGAIIASMMLSNRLIAPIGQIAGAVLRSRSALEAYRTLNDILALPDERQVQRQFVSRTVERGKIEFRKVRFAYPESDTFVLDQVSLTIQPGEKVGIIGRIGSGKTTLGRLLVKFYEPTEGEILIDDVSIKQYHPAALRRQIGFVIQDPELFAGTIKENIILADPTASDERIIDVARRSGVEAFVSRHPKGFDMPVGERGSLLSGGQRQAVALARTMLVDPQVLFLDEPSSSMDLATERELIKHLGITMDSHHTVIIATHRHSLLSLIKRLIVVDNGRIVADGPRDAVLEQLRANSASREAL